MRDTHSGIARRVFDAVGPASKPVQVVHADIYAKLHHWLGRPPQTASAD